MDNRKDNSATLIALTVCVLVVFLTIVVKIIGNLL